MLYCIVLYCIVLYCIVLYCNVLYAQIFNAQNYFLIKILASGLLLKFRKFQPR